MICFVIGPGSESFTLDQRKYIGYHGVELIRIICLRWKDVLDGEVGSRKSIAETVEMITPWEVC